MLTRTSQLNMYTWVTQMLSKKIIVHIRVSIISKFSYLNRPSNHVMSNSDWVNRIYESEYYINKNIFRVLLFFLKGHFACKYDNII